MAVEGRCSLRAGLAGLAAVTTLLASKVCTQFQSTGRKQVLHVASGSTAGTLQFVVCRVRVDHRHRHMPVTISGAVGDFVQLLRDRGYVAVYRQRRVVHALQPLRSPSAAIP